MGYITVSTKVRRSLVEKARKYGINLSELMRKAIEDEVRKREIEWALTVMDEISSKAKLDKPSKELIREFRDSRAR
ncbi:MAG: type II toxin-antitoxin system CcdA family antitoxin [Candidatus Methanodesulfokora sp.]|nr:MAG: VapB-type antitoxin [Candidatus Korarchaeota archaeon]